MHGSFDDHAIELLYILFVITQSETRRDLVSTNLSLLL